MGVADSVVYGEDIRTDPSSGNKGRVLYVRMKPQDVMGWYDEPNPLVPGSSSSSITALDEEGLIAGDGVHPNAKCYALWARSLAKHLLSQQPNL